jgi:aldose 1-epimerase
MLTLRSGASSVVVAPEYGAGLTGWMVGCTPVLRRALPQASAEGDSHAMGCFPLLPYGNRIGGGRFRWRGTDYVLQRNFGDHPHTIHGVGWQSAWTVNEATACSVILALRHKPGPSWPFAFDAVVGYCLSDAALTVTIRLTNRHDTPTPAGIGVHPYFPRTNDPALRFKALGIWENGDDALPLCHGSPSADRQHTDPRAIARSRLDNCFTEWDGTADIEAGPAGVHIVASEVFRQLQVFTPPWAGFFCVEPVSHVPDALNRRDLPVEQAMHVLLPDECLSGTVCLTPTSSPARGAWSSGATATGGEDCLGPPTK